MPRLGPRRAGAMAPASWQVVATVEHERGSRQAPRGERPLPVRGVVDFDERWATDRIISEFLEIAIR